MSGSTGKAGRRAVSGEGPAAGPGAGARRSPGGRVGNRFPQVEFMLSVAAPPQFPPDQGGEVAFAGRSNAGPALAYRVRRRQRWRGRNGAGGLWSRRS